MGIQINGNNDIISALDGSWTAEGASINTSGILTATTFEGNVTGTACTFVDGKFTGNVTIGGTLTYEDVTNIDSVGLVTARSGLKVTSGQLDVGSNIKLGNAGVVTATSFVGGLPITSGSSWRVVTSSNASTLKGETNLQFDGTDLYISDGIKHKDDTDTEIGFPAADQIQFDTGGTNYLKLHRYASVNFVEIGASASISLADNGANTRAILIGDGNASSTGKILMQAGAGSATFGGGLTLYSHANSTNAGGVYIGKSQGSSGSIIFGNGGTGPTNEYLRITSVGKVGINTDNPGYKLQVHDSDGSLFRVLTGHESTYDLRYVYQNSEANIWSYGSTDLTFGTRYNKKLHLVTNGPGKRLTIDGSGKVGINSTSPTYALEVDGGTQNTVIAVRSSDAKAAISFLDNTSGGYGRATIGGEGDSVYITSGGGTERIRFGTGGSNNTVGINTTLNLVTNSEILSVRGYSSFKSISANYAAIYTHNEGNTSGTYNAHLLWNAGGANRGGIGYMPNTGDVIINNHQALIFATGATQFGGTERLRIASSGGVGISTTLIRNQYFINIAAPSQAFSGSTNLTDGGGIMFQHTDTLASTGRTYPGIFWAGNTASLGRARAGILGVTASNNDATDIVFLTRYAADGTAFYPTDEKVRIKSSGKVEIGSSNDYGSNPGMLNIGRRSADPGGVSVCIARGEVIGGGTGPVLEFVHGPDGGTQRIHSIYSYVGDLRVFADTNESLELRGTQTIFKDNNNTIRMRVKSDLVVTENNVGFEAWGGTGNHTNDTVILSQKSNNNDWCYKAQASDGTSTDYGMYIRCHSGGSYVYSAYQTDNNQWIFRVGGNGTIYAINTSITSISDRRLKENIVDANSQWDDIKALKFKNFTWKNSNDTAPKLGLISDEVEAVAPNLVELNPQSKEDIENNVPDPEYKNVKYSIVWMKAVKALQEAQARIETLEAKVAALESS